MSDPSRIALVTGASTGIGRAVAVELAARGWRVAINYPDAGELENAAETLRRVRESAPSGSDDAGLLVEGDVSREDDVEAMFRALDDEPEPLGALVNNAGVQFEDPSSHEATVDQFDTVLAINLRGAFLASSQAIRRFLDASPRGGQILNVSSVHQKIPRPFYLSYAVSKFGLQGLTETLALEYASRGIRVNAIAPGATRTPIQSWLGDADTEAVIESHIPMGRVAEPDEIARIAAFLLSDDAGYITGQTLFADGGLTLYPEFREPWSG